MQKTVLIVGASGLVGSAALEHFLSLDDWNVIAVSRRLPEVNSKRPFKHLSVDLRDEFQCRKVFSKLSNVSHVVYAALYEKPGLVQGWFEKDQMEINLQMLRNLMEPLTEGATGLQHVSLMQGTKAYGLHVHPIPIPAKESAPRDKHDNFYWLQEDYLVAKAREKNFCYTILRPPLILGASYGTAMSVLTAIGAYAAICHELGEPCGYPGGASNVFEAVDSRLVARVLAWAATEPKAVNRTFNVNNGDVCEWRNLWPAIAKTLGVEVGPDTPREMKSFLPDNADVWDQIVEKYKLRKIPIHELLGESHHFADLLFAVGEKDLRPPAFTSTFELRKAGFTEYVDSETAICELLTKLMQRNVLPTFKNN